MKEKHNLSWKTRFRIKTTLSSTDPFFIGRINTKKNRNSSVIIVHSTRLVIVPADVGFNLFILTLVSKTFELTTFPSRRWFGRRDKKKANFIFSKEMADVTNWIDSVVLSRWEAHFISYLLKIGLAIIDVERLPKRNGVWCTASCLPLEKMKL